MGTLTVQTLQAPTSGANANKLLVGSGHTLYAAGHTIQTVRTEYRTYASSASTSFAATGLTATITPTSTSSKILAHVIMNGMYMTGDANHIKIHLYKASSSVATLTTTAGYKSAGDEPSYGVYTNVYEHLDSPSTTSATTYTVYWAVSAGTAYINNYNVGTTSNLSSITLQEIAQ